MCNEEQNTYHRRTDYGQLGVLASSDRSRYDERGMNDCVKQAEKSSQVMEQLEILSKEVGIVQSRVEELGERLISVLICDSVDENEKAGKEIEPGLVPLAGIVRHETKRLYNTVSALRSLIDRLEL